MIASFIIGSFIIIAPIWLMFAIAVGAVAQERGRSGVGWFFHAVFFSPLFALACLACCPVLAKAEEEPLRQPSKILTKDCPDCGETVKGTANVCRFCGYRAPQAEQATSSTLTAERVNPLIATQDCRRCGAMLSSNATRCQRCGVSVDPMAET
jgi:ribosomal protein L40E